MPTPSSPSARRRLKACSSCGRYSCTGTCPPSSAPSSHPMHIAHGAARMWGVIVSAVVFGGLTLAIVSSTAYAESTTSSRSTVSSPSVSAQIDQLNQRVDRLQQTVDILLQR